MKRPKRSYLAKCSAFIALTALLVSDGSVRIFAQTADDAGYYDEETASWQDVYEEDGLYTVPDDEDNVEEYESSDDDAASSVTDDEGDELLDAPFSVRIHDFAADADNGIPQVNKLEVGHGYAVDYDIVPETYEDLVKVTVTSSSGEVADINKDTGMVFPNKSGDVTVTVTAADKLDDTVTASASLNVKCVYPKKKFFDFYGGKRFAFTEDELYENGWLSCHGSSFFKEKKDGDYDVYYFKDGKAYSKRILTLPDGTTYLFDTETCKLIKEWVKIKTLVMEDIPADANPSGPIADNMLSYGTSYVMTAKFNPVNANDSLDPEWTSDAPSVIKVTPLGWNGNEIHARIDVLKRSDDPVEIKVSAGEPENPHEASVMVYARYPLGWFKKGDESFYGVIKPGSPVDVEFATGLTTIGGREYYFEPDGHMFTGMKEIGGYLYDFGENGVKRAQYEMKGFVDLPEGTVFYNDLGIIETDKIVTDGTGHYYVDASGFLQKGYFSVGSKKYYALTEDDRSCGMKAGMLQSGWVLSDGRWRLFADEDDAEPFAEIASSSENGWIQADTGKRYYRKAGGKFLKGWQPIDGEKYYFNEDGSVASGLTEINGKYYYFGETANWDHTTEAPAAGDDFGIMKTGRISYGGHVNFFGSAGYRLNGWQKYTEGGTDKWDFFDISTAESLNAQAIPGKMGWYEIDRGGDKAWFYFRDNRTLAKGWQTVGTGKYYFDSRTDINGVSGRMAVGVTSIGASKYYFREKMDENHGILLTGYKDEEDADGIMRTYLADPSGALQLGWQKPVPGGEYAFFDYTLGYKLDNVYAEGNNWAIIKEPSGLTDRYFKSYFKGTKPVTGLQDIGGRKYFFGKDKSDRNYGRAMTGLIRNGSSLYYARPYDDTVKAEAEKPEAAELMTGWITSLESGVSVTRYADSRCAIQKGWQTIEGKRYYFDTLTGIMSKGAVLIGKSRYVFDDSGCMMTGYAASGGEHYFTNNKGVMLFGYQNAGGTARFFEPDPESAYYGMESAFSSVCSFDTSEMYASARGTVFIIKNGRIATGWQKLEYGGITRRYYADTNGIVKTGSFAVGKDSYVSYTQTEAASLGQSELTGSVRTGMITEGGSDFYYDDNGKRCSGWVKIGADHFYFDPATGEMMKGFFTVGKNTYYTDDEGKRQTGTVTVSGNTYYFDDKTGAMRTGWQTIKTGGINNKHWFDEKGRMASGISLISGKRYVLDGDGVLKVKFYGTVSGMSGVFASDASGVMKTGWQLIDDHGVTDWHYFDALSGKESVLSGTPEEIGDVTWYTVAEFFEGNKKTRAKFAFRRGKSLKGWQKLGGRKYFFDENGKLATGFWDIDGGRYYFSETASDGDPSSEGMMYAKGVYNVSGRHYYMSSSGVLKTDWFDEKGDKYYADPETGVLATGFAKIGSSIYYFSEADSSIGIMQTGFIEVTDIGQTYYDRTGAGASNMYYAGSDGAVVQSGWFNVKHEPKVSDSQEWSYYAAPNRPYIDMGDFILTGELASGDVLMDDAQNVSAYLDDGRESRDGFASGAACKRISATGEIEDGSVMPAEIGRYYRFDSRTCARRKEVLFFFGNYYGHKIDDDQRETVRYMRQFINTDKELDAETGDFILVNTDRAALTEKDLTSYPSASFPMCASNSVEDEKGSYVAESDLDSDGHVDVYDTETYAKDVYDRAISKYGPRNLVLAGGSSGAGICLGLYDYAIKKGTPLKLPSQVLLMSPWVDVRMNNASAAALSNRMTGTTDIETLKYWGARYTRDGDYEDESGTKPYAGIEGAGADYPFASPVLLDSTGMKNVYMYSGTYDPCYYDCAVFVNRANSLGNTDIKLRTYPGARHGFMFYKKVSSAKTEVFLDVCRRIMTEEH